MKKTGTSRRSNLFLMELILAILFFSLASAICMQLFLKAHTLSKETSASSHALANAKSCAAAFESEGGSLEHLQKLYANALLSENILVIYYDKDWNLCSESEFIYRMTVTRNTDSTTSGLVTGSVQVEGTSILCTLKVSSLTPSLAS